MALLLLKARGDLMDFIRGSSSYARIGLHVTFKVKYCHEVFDIEAFRNRCREIFMCTASEQRVCIEEIGFDGDHVHMVWQVMITHQIDRLVKIFKGRSGKFLLREFPEVKRKYFWGSGLWGAQVYVDSIGRNMEQTKNYVRNQRYGAA
jgi:putative transposase